MSRSSSTTAAASPGGDSQPTPATDAQRSLAALLPTTGKFTRRLCDSIRERDSCWHRLSVKVVGGKIKTVQLILDETVDLEVDLSEP